MKQLTTQAIAVLAALVAMKGVEVGYKRGAAMYQMRREQQRATVAQQWFDNGKRYAEEQAAREAKAHAN